MTRTEGLAWLVGIGGSLLLLGVIFDYIARHC